MAVSGPIPLSSFEPFLTEDLEIVDEETTATQITFRVKEGCSCAHNKFPSVRLQTATFGITAFRIKQVVLRGTDQDNMEVGAYISSDNAIIESITYLGPEFTSVDFTAYSGGFNPIAGIFVRTPKRCGKFTITSFAYNDVSATCPVTTPTPDPVALGTNIFRGLRGSRHVTIDRVQSDRLVATVDTCETCDFVYIANTNVVVQTNVVYQWLVSGSDDAFGQMQVGLFAMFDGVFIKTGFLTGTTFSAGPTTLSLAFFVPAAPSLITPPVITTTTITLGIYVRNPIKCGQFTIYNTMQFARFLEPCVGVAGAEGEEEEVSSDNTLVDLDTQGCVGCTGLLSRADSSHTRVAASNQSSSNSKKASSSSSSSSNQEEVDASSVEVTVTTKQPSTPSKQVTTVKRITNMKSIDDTRNKVRTWYRS